jgi:hypothetical protein
MRYLSLQEVISLHSLLISQSGGSRFASDSVSSARTERVVGGQLLRFLSFNRTILAKICDTPFLSDDPCFRVRKSANVCGFHTAVLRHPVIRRGADLVFAETSLNTRLLQLPENLLELGYSRRLVQGAY